MPRRRGAENREVAPDPVYGSTLVEKFVCSMMWDGKKQTAQKIFYASMKKLEEKGGGEEAIKLFKKAVENAKPLLEGGLDVLRIGNGIALRNFTLTRHRLILISGAWRRTSNGSGGGW